MIEIWKSVNGYEGLYEVSNMGIVRSIGIRGKTLKPIPDKDGYLQVTLCKDKTRKTKKIHRLVIEAFKGNSSLTAHHIDSNKTNNNVENLEYVGRGHNARIARIKPVLQFDKFGNFIKEWDSATDAGKSLDIFSENISSCCNRKRPSAGGFVWRFKHE